MIGGFRLESMSILHGWWCRVINSVSFSVPWKHKLVYLYHMGCFKNSTHYWFYCRCCLLLSNGFGAIQKTRREILQPHNWGNIVNLYALSLCMCHIIRYPQYFLLTVSYIYFGISISMHCVYLGLVGCDIITSRHTRIAIYRNFNIILVDCDEYAKRSQSVMCVSVSRFPLIR